MAKFEDFVKKAEGRYKETTPYKMELEDTVYEIASPDAVQMLELSELDDHQMLAQLKVIFRKNPLLGVLWYVSSKARTLRSCRLSLRTCSRTGTKKVSPREN